MRRALIVIGLCGLLLAGCDAGPSAVVQDGKGQSPQSTQPAPPQVVAHNDAPPSQDVVNAYASAAAAPIAEAAPPQMGKALPLPGGKRALISDTAYGDWPLWSKNRKYSADDNAHYQFEHHGPEIGARSYGDFLAMVHGFVHNPPAGTETLKRRNGDTLYYNARENVFAVMTKQGAPRTLFRPREGGAYWTQQKDIEASGGWQGGRGSDGG